jgi:hypothetical protein
MRILPALLAASFLVCGARAFAQDCVPAFYNAEPRDAQWYYGAGKGADADAARRDALDHLYLKIAGGENDVPREVLAGWEQDDHGECRGVHYVIDRIEQERARRNLAEILKRRPAPAASAPLVSTTVVVNNISVAPAVVNMAREDDKDLKYIVLAVAFLAFVIGVIAFLRGRSGPAYAGGPSLDVVSEPKPRSAAPPSSLAETFQAVLRQPQSEALTEIASKGIFQYLKDHKGEGMCKSVPGSPELVFAGLQAIAQRYQAQGWKIANEPRACYAYSGDGGVAMGFAFRVYASKLSGYTDAEISYAIGAGIDDNYHAKMEGALQENLPWTIQMIAMRQGASKS